MKAISVGLEVEVTVTGEERDSLLDSPLKGILYFDDTMLFEGSTKRRFPFSLAYDPTVGESIKAECVPERAYFGDLKSCRMTLGKGHYDRLKVVGQCKDKISGIETEVTIRVSG